MQSITKEWRLSRKSWVVFVSLILALTVSIFVGSADAQVKSVPREKTVIFDIDGGRTVDPQL